MSLATTWQFMMTPVFPVRGCVAAEPYEVILVVTAAEEEGDLDGARTLRRALHRAPHPERLEDDSISIINVNEVLKVHCEIKSN